MRIHELRAVLEALPDDWPVTLWDDNTASRGPALYTTFTDGELTIAGTLEAKP